ncbi:MAG: hypothetical protein GY863_18130, partial [bacterium]|nr:hypothetical protein [bacterium]
MKCSVVKDLLTAYVDSELSDESQAQIDSHLEECGSCRKEMQVQMGVHRLLSEKLERVKADPELKQQIIRNTVEQNTAEGLWFFRKLKFELRPATGFAIAAMLVFGFISREIFFERLSLFPSGTYETHSITTLTDGVESSVEGKLICVGCYLKNKYGALHDCKLHGHELGILTSDGTIWKFTDTELSDLVC